MKESINQNFVPLTLFLNLEEGKTFENKKRITLKKRSQGVEALRPPLGSFIGVQTPNGLFRAKVSSLQDIDGDWYECDLEYVGD